MRNSERHGCRAAAMVLAACLAWLCLEPMLNLAVGAPEPDRARIEELYKQIAPLEELYRLVVEKVAPSVVHIATRGTRTILPRQRFPRGSPFERFGEEFFRFFDIPREIPQNALGSGVIVDKEGHILTNNHVIERADTITVKLFDGSEYDAKVVGRDDMTDLAVLKIDPKGKALRPATLGDSTTVKVGTMVLAIGSPFGLDETVTSGVISATARAGVGVAKYEDFLQTDAAINPGNSGGPLVNLRGEVIGINTAIVTASGSFAGVGFAIPSSMANKVMNDLIHQGRVVRGWLGVMIQSLYNDLAEQFGLEQTDGALVSHVYPDTPAAKAGLQRGDVIVEFDGKPIASSAQLMNIVAVTPVGKRVTIVVIRDRKRVTLEAEIAERTEEAVASASGTAETTSKELGITVQTLTPELAEQLGYGREDKGVVVTDVQPGSPAEEKGIARGDLILEVNRQQVNSVEEYLKAVRGADLKKGVLLWLQKRDGGRTFVVVVAED